MNLIYFTEETESLKPTGRLFELSNKILILIDRIKLDADANHTIKSFSKIHFKTQEDSRIHQFYSLSSLKPFLVTLFSYFLSFLPTTIYLDNS